ncbi:cysteine peptidase family C39 domain-containing protein [Ureaplasma diversum]|uniref:ABC transporter, permease and ATP-binding component n=1 Tax=Ureaplasma diversum NCTC 246 TaxID=1188241 RepID=A0A084F133_9BACT|nr:cysteine peptidase family C39 domain-containing protein [Ureaplasma diversum]KEZ23925.1 ABC transporter, permease and ATP-binding component [Ureaplasma diversum NCTC 246]
MKIVNQIINNECGICVLAMIINHYKKSKITKNELLAKANLSVNGISVFELERLANEYSLNASSYECKAEEVFELAKDDYYVVLVNKDNLAHFNVIKVISDQKLKVYDPKDGVYYWDLDQFSKCFLGVLVQFNKQNDVLKVTSFDQSYLKSIRVIDLIIIFLLELVSIPISIIISRYLNYVINFVIVHQILKNLLQLSLVFFFFFLINSFKQLLFDLFITKQTNRIYITIMNYINNQLMYKQQSFYAKTNMGELSQIPSHILSIINFLLVVRTKLYTNVLYACVISVILGLNDWLLLSISLGFVILNGFVALFSYLYNKKMASVLLNHSQKNFIKYQTFLNLIKEAFFINKSTIAKNDYDQVQANLMNDTNKSTLVNSHFKTINNIFNALSLLLITSVYVYLKISKNQPIDVGNLTFLLFLHQNVSSGINTIFDYLNNQASYQQAKMIVEKVLFMNNINRDGSSLTKIDSVQVSCFSKNYSFDEHTLIIGHSGSGKTSLLKAIIQFYEPHFNVYFNQQSAFDFDFKQIVDKVIYQPSTISNVDFDLAYFMNQIPDSQIDIVFKKLSQFTNINWELATSQELSERLSMGQRQIVSFLSLLKYKNKLLLLDEPLSHVDGTTKAFVLVHLLPIIKENNLVLYVSHDNLLTDHFIKVVNLNA